MAGSIVHLHPPFFSCQSWDGRVGELEDVKKDIGKGVYVEKEKMDIKREWMKDEKGKYV